MSTRGAALGMVTAAAAAGFAFAGSAAVRQRGRIEAAARSLTVLDAERTRRQRAEELATTAFTQLDEMRSTLTQLEIDQIRLGQREHLRRFIRQHVPEREPVLIIGSGTGDLLGLRNHDLLWLQSSGEQATDDVLIERLDAAAVSGVRFAVTLATSMVWLQNHSGVDSYVRTRFILRQVEEDGSTLLEFDLPRDEDPLPFGDADFDVN